MSFFVAAQWELPHNILDLYPEYRRIINGKFDAHGKRVGSDDHRNTDGRTKYGLLSAALHYGIASRTAAEKQSMIKRILQGSPYWDEERAAILDYNRDDVEDTECLFAAMVAEGGIQNAGQALLRGDATRGFAIRDLNGLPVDCALVTRLTRHWQAIRAGTVQDIEARRQYGVFRFDSDGTTHFDYTKAAALVQRLGMQNIWPKTESGKFSFADPDRGPDLEKPLKMMATLNPYLEDLREAKRLMGRTGVMDLPIGADGRCHGSYFPWVQVSGRSSPGRGSIFAMSKWTRWLITPGPGRGIAYVDLKSAEFGIAAALSHDSAMKQDYHAMLDGTIECVYFEVAKWAGQVPLDAWVKDYKAVRDGWKMACLAMMYGQSAESLSSTTGISLSEARVIQSAFKARYSAYWAWATREIVHAHTRGSIETVCGWRMAVNQRFGGPTEDSAEERTLLNFHPQATCADIMRRAVALMADRGIGLCEIVHDAVVVETTIETLNETVEATKDCWREASAEILGFELGADAQSCMHPDRFQDQGGKAMWEVLMQLLKKTEGVPEPIDNTNAT